MRRRQSDLITIVVVVALFIPLVVFVVRFFPSRTPVGWLALFRFGLVQASLSVIFSFLISIGPALAAARGGIIGRSVSSLTFIPFFFPVVSAGLAFSALYEFIARHPGVELRGTVTGIVIAHVFYQAPLFIKYVGEALAALPPQLDELFALDAASPLTRFWQRVRMVKPALGRAAALAFIYSFTSFVLVSSLGLGRFATPETAIVDALFGSANFSEAACLGLLQAVFLAGAHFFIPKKASIARGAISGKPIKSGRLADVWSILYLMAVGVVLLFLLKNMSFDSWRIFIPGRSGYPIWRSIFNTFILAGVSSLLAVVVGFWAAGRRYGSGFFAMIFFSSALWATALYYFRVLTGAPTALLSIWGLLGLAVPVTYNFLRPVRMTLDPSVIEAARLDGAGGGAMVKKIYWPLASGAIIGVFLQTFALCYGEFTFSYFLSNESFPLVQSTLFRLQSRRRLSDAAALSLFNLIIIWALFSLGESRIRALNRTNGRDAT